jgi:prohibitin 1
MFRAALVLLPLAVALSACATTIFPGEVGVRSNFGRLEPSAYGPGIVSHSPIGVRWYRVPTRTRALDLAHDVTSHRGALLHVEASVVYATRAELASKLIAEIGPQFERELLDPVFRWATQRVYAEARARSRENLTELIRDHMNERLAPRGIVVEQVILRRSALTSDLVYRAFQQRMTEEQRSEQMKFVIDRERQESQRRVIEAQGQADAHAILSDGLTPAALQNEAITTFEKLVRSRNARLILTNGPTPLLID